MIWVGAQKFGTLIITFLSNIILARLLSPDDYGMIGMLAIFIAISNTFIDGGFGSALIQKSHPTQKDYSTVFYWNIFLGVALYILLYASAPLIESFYNGISGLTKVLRIQGIILIINAFAIVQANQLRKLMSFKALAKINIVSATISMICALIMAYAGCGVWALVGQQIVMSAVNCCLLYLTCKWKPQYTFSFYSLKSLFSFGSFMMMSSLVNTLGNNINGLLIGRFYSPATLGYFTQAKKLEDVSSIGILTVVEQVTYPMLVEVNNDFQRMARVLSKFNSALLGLTVPFLYCIFLAASPIIVFLFSDKWLPSAPILQVLAIHGIFICMQGSNYNAIAAIGLSKVLFKWTIIKRIFGIGMTIGLLFIFGFNGLLWGIVLSGAFIAFCNMYLVARFISFSFWSQLKAILPVLTLGTLPFLGFYIIEIIIQHRLDNFSLYLESGLGVLYLIVYILILLFAPFNSIQMLKQEMKTLLKRNRS